MAEASAKWYSENKEYAAKAGAKWRKENPEKVYTKRAKYRANRHNACTPTTCHKTIALFELHKPEGYHLDHKVPLNKGGLHHQDNLMYVPANLNLRKSDKLLSEHPKLEAEYNQEAISPFKFI